MSTILLLLVAQTYEPANFKPWEGMSDLEFLIRQLQLVQHVSLLPQLTARQSAKLETLRRFQHELRVLCSQFGVKSATQLSQIYLLEPISVDRPLPIKPEE